MKDSFSLKWKRFIVLLHFMKKHFDTRISQFSQKFRWLMTKGRISRPQRDSEITMISFREKSVRRNSAFREYPVGSWLVALNIKCTSRVRARDSNNGSFVRGAIIVTKHETLSSTQHSFRRSM